MIEIVPPNRRRGKGLEAPKVNYEKRSEKMKEVNEAKEQEQEDSERVAEKLMDELEDIGIKGKRCGLKNVRENKELVGKEGGRILECVDCKYRWEE